MKTLQLHVLAVLCCVGLTTSLFAQTTDRGSITLKDDKGHEVKLIPQKNAPLGSWVFEIPYAGFPSGSGGHQTPQANPLGDEPYITFVSGSTDLSNNRVLAAGSGLSITTGSTDNSNITLANTGVLSLTGTANQVSVSAATGAVTLSLPQNIHTGASPTFTNASLTAIPASSTFSNIVVSNGGALQTRTIASLGKADGSEPLLTFSTGGTSMTNNRVLSPGFGIAFTNVGTDNGAFTIENSGVVSAIGTANQVSVSGATGNVTFSLPQNIHTAATPTFSGMTLSALPTGSASDDIVVSNAGVLQTRTLASLGKADGSEPIVTFGAGSAGLTNNRVLTAGTGISITDGGGDNGPITIAATSTGWSLSGNNFAVGDFIGGEAGNTNPLELRTNNTTRLKLNDDASIQRDDAGDARGIYATDMQAYRSMTDQVASGMLATISGGGDNRANGFIGATVSGGVANTASGFNYATVSGGSSNTASGFNHPTIGGGNMNTASSNFSTVAGGKANQASGQGSFVGGGGFDGSTAGNIASGPATTISGGYNNDAGVDYATVSGGASNQAMGYAAAIGGGESNQASNYGATVGGGVQNYAYEFVSTISGGAGNTVNEEMGTIGGGLSNTAYGVASTISGGYLNTANSDSTTIGGGSYNTTFARSATIGGGSSNRAFSIFATVGGGHFNYAGGGQGATVSGGDGNTANALSATVAGGRANNASHQASTVSGGDSNWGANDGASVGGGFGNTASGIQATVAGGGGNQATAGSSTVSGGHFNLASGAFSAVPGGTENIASGERSTAMGFRTNATRYGQVSHAGGRFETTGDAQGSLAALRNATTDSTTAELFLDGTSLRFTIANNSAVAYSILVVGKTSDGQSAGYQFNGIIERVSFTTSMIGTPVKTVLGEDDAVWDANVSADNANGSLKIEVSGNASDTIRWVATIRTSEVTY